MIRWWCCCGLVLGLTAIAWGDPPRSDPLFRQLATAGQGESNGRPTFGLQARMGRDESPERSNAFGNSTASRAGTFSTQGGEPTGSSLVQLSFQPDFEEPPFVAVESWFDQFDWQVLPVGVMYKSYLAGEKESRVQSVWVTDQRGNLVWETALGGRFGILRYGTFDPAQPEGWQFDFEGAALPRVDPDDISSPLIACDYRIGLLSTWRFGPNAVKAGYYHLSSHLGDEFLINNPGFVRLNYVRDAAIVGWTHDLTPETQLYGEVAYAFNHEDGALPWEFQYGIQYSPRTPGLLGGPFGAINGHTREDFNWATSINAVAGWQWWNEQSNHTLRVGIQYYDGPALQYSFVNKHETLMGWGLWFDY